MRRWTGAIACLVGLGIVAFVVPRLGSRSPLAVVLLCVLAVLTVRLVERRIRQWFQRWEEQQAGRIPPPDGRP